MKLPPLGLAYLASFLKEKGYPCEVLDLNVSFYHKFTARVKSQWLKQSSFLYHDDFFDKVLQDFDNEIKSIIDKIKAQSFNAVGFSVFRSNRTFSVRLAQRIKAEIPHIKIIFGGPETMEHKNSQLSLFPEDIKEVVDYMVVGEGEKGLLKVLSGIKNKKDIPFIVESEEFYDLDDITHPTYDEFDLSLYERKRALPILASRGCIRLCHFCSERLLSKTFRMRSARDILDEIQMHMRERDIVWFTFHDSLINGNFKILYELCRLILERNISIKWEAQAIIRDDMDSDLLSLMKQAGCFNLFIGLESGSDGVLEKMNRGYTTEGARRFFRKCKSAGLHFEVSMIVGFPGEGDKEFAETIRFIGENKDLIPKIAQINPFIIYHGATIGRELESSKGSYKINQEFSASLERVNALVDYLKSENIIFTPSFVNNLITQGYKL